MERRKREIKKHVTSSPINSLPSTALTIKATTKFDKTEFEVPIGTLVPTMAGVAFLPGFIEAKGQHVDEIRKEYPELAAVMGEGARLPTIEDFHRAINPKSNA